MISDLRLLVPWLAGLSFVPKLLISAVIVLLAAFVLLLVWLPPSRVTSPKDAEIEHRLAYMREHLAHAPLTIGDAYAAVYAALGGGGAFRVTDQEFKEISLSSLSTSSERYRDKHQKFRDLELALEGVPGGSSTTLVDPQVVAKLREHFRAIETK